MQQLIDGYLLGASRRCSPRELGESGRAVPAARVALLQASEHHFLRPVTVSSHPRHARGSGHWSTHACSHCCTTAPLNRKNFAETGRGVCRIRPSLASQLAETLPSWRTNIAPAVERVAQTLADNGPTKLDVPTSLSGADRRVSWHARRVPEGTKAVSIPPLPATCRGCGGELSSRSRRFCDRCRRASAERAGHSARAAAATALERLREDGRDPAPSLDGAAPTGRACKSVRRRALPNSPLQIHRHVLRLEVLLDPFLAALAPEA
jgi:hypothetical protein